jgi:RNA polymerase sigma-70 factor (ECF subfamily)
VRQGDGTIPESSGAVAALDLDATSDEEAIRRVLAGDRDAFAVLVERYQGRAFRLALRVLRNEESARDAVQDAFLKAYSSLSRFQGRSSFYTWLYRLVMNQCLDMKRRDRSDRHVEWEDGGAVESGANAPLPPEVAGVRFAPAASMMRRELREQIAEAIERLPDGPRETLILRELDGLSYTEIAKTQRIPKGTVMSRLHYARKQLQAYLIEMGVATRADARVGEEAK